MHDPNFEKTVQQKMEELQFHPAESVWVNIEKAVGGQRRRRGLPIFWRLALPVVLAAAVTGVYYAASNRKDRVLSYSSANAGAKGAKDGSVDAVSRPSAGPDAALARGAGADVRVTRGKDGAAVSDGSTIRLERGAGIRNNLLNNRRAKVAAEVKAAASKAMRRDLKDGPEGHAIAEPEKSLSSSILAVAPAKAGLEAWFYRPELVDQRRTQAIKAAQLNKKAAIALARLPQKTRPWEAGFVAGGGISRLNRLNADQAPAAVSYLAASFYNLNGSRSGKGFISDVQPDASFSGGVYLQKPLSDRWIFNTGMTLHYYSTHITIGQQVTTYVQAAASFVNPTAQAALNSSAVYSAGNRQSYINKYYTLELPVNMQWRVNKSHLLPMFLEGGLSLSRLMGSDALLYDSETGVYSKQGTDINKTQLNVSTAFLVGLPIHGLHVQVGPQVQYGLTPLVDDHSLGDQHFFYAGIKLVIIPGKK